MPIASAYASASRLLSSLLVIDLSPFIVSRWLAGMDASAVSSAHQIGSQCQCSRRGPIQKSCLDTCIAPGRGRPRIWGIWGRRRWLDVVLAVQPESLDHFERVLLVLIYVGMRGLKERGGRLDGCVHSFDRPIALKAGDCHLGFHRSCHSATSKGSLGSEFIPSRVNVEGAGVRSAELRPAV